MGIVKQIYINKGQTVETILRALSDWFEIESSILNYIKDVENMDMFVLEEESKPVGFIAINKHNRYTAEIHVIGVLEEFHRKGIGRKLVEHSEEQLKNAGFEFFTVKTLAPSIESEEYRKTRLFYESLGFKPLEEFKTFWDEDNPCLFLDKYIG